MKRAILADREDANQDDAGTDKTVASVIHLERIRRN